MGRSVHDSIYNKKYPNKNTLNIPSEKSKEPWFQELSW